ncbi:class F sortase [Nocardioides plantarum]|uniref:Class F sortase n=1 Tax=Nocardioides plantarum TaxID=29299 RepID=A0ABV5K9B7_9ACTN|nr:class F sortase [Nocardioides plantarum]
MSNPLDITGGRGASSGRRWRQRALLVLVPVLVAVVIVAAVVLGGRESDPSTQGPGSGSAAEQSSTPTPTPTAPPTSRATPAPPTRLIVRSLAIDAPVVDIDLGTDAVLEPPSDPDLVGYWTGSAKVGATRGRTVITGHTVQRGDGALDRLPRIKRGATVTLADRTGTHRYRVTDNLYVTYKDVAKRAQEIFGQTTKAPEGAPLVLVTCTEFNGRFYEGNSIVVAEPVGPGRADPAA